VLGLAAGLIAVCGVWLACATPRYVRVGLIVLLTVSGAILAVAFQSIASSILAIGLSLFDKDPTLTGRTYLWYRAKDLIAQKPGLGRGYSAFWQQGNSDAEGLWQYAGITGRSGFNFHNAAIAVEVELGYAGLAIFLLIAIVALYGLMKHMVVRPTLALSFWVGMVSYFLVRAPFEAFGTEPFYYSTALLFAAAGIAMEKLAPAPRRRPNFVNAMAARRLYFQQLREVSTAPAALCAIQRAGQPGVSEMPQT
jgi:exopolysaccharide production protein ExoQ